MTRYLWQHRTKQHWVPNFVLIMEIWFSATLRWHRVEFLAFRPQQQLSFHCSTQYICMNYREIDHSWSSIIQFFTIFDKIARKVFVFSCLSLYLYLSMYLSLSSVWFSDNALLVNSLYFAVVNQGLATHGVAVTIVSIAGEPWTLTISCNCSTPFDGIRRSSVEQPLFFFMQA